MYIRILTVSCFLIMSILTYSQELRIVKKEQLTYSNQGSFYFPKFTPDGNRIFFARDNFKGISYFDLKNWRLDELNAEYGAGYGFGFSSDSKFIYYRKDEFKKGLKYSSIYKQEISSKKKETILSGSREVSPPLITKQGNCFFTQKGKVKYITQQGKPVDKSKLAKESPMVLNEDGNLYVFRNGSKKLINPSGKNAYIWAELSPDEKYIVYTVAADQTYICDLNGKIKYKLGYANAPKWSPDGKWILFMDDKNNGNDYTSSELWVVSMDGSKRIQLTKTDNEIELYPEWSPSGNKITYHTIDGNIFILAVGRKD